MIKQLTPAQTARFPEFVEKWTKIGLSTEPADRPRAEAAIRLVYEAVQFSPPEKILWFKSPKAMWAENDRAGLRNPIKIMVKTSDIMEPYNFFS
jgi:hypothetical protein